MLSGLVALALLGLAAFASPATAQDEGSAVDPDSPTAKEYAIPLERARRQADPSGASHHEPPSARVAPLFGEGVTPSDAQRADSGGETSTGRTRDGAKASRRGASRRDGDEASGTRRDDGLDVPEAVAAAAQQPGPPAGGIGSTLLVGGVAGFVLAVGALGGLVLRRRRGDA